MSSDHHLTAVERYGGSIMKASSNPKPHSEKRNLQWDEETIAEHDKERGTRQKIDEPPTPFHYDDEEEEEEDNNNSYTKSDRDCTHAMFSSDEDDEASTMKSGDDEIVIQLPSGINKMQSSSPITFSVADSWSQLSATLAYHQQAQLESESRNLAMTTIENDNTSLNDMAMDNDDRKDRPTSFHLPDSTRDVQKSDGDFKSKRNKHYNEYLIMQAAKKKILEDDEDDDDEDGL